MQRHKSFKLMKLLCKDTVMTWKNKCGNIGFKSECYVYFKKQINWRQIDFDRLEKSSMTFDLWPLNPILRVFVCIGGGGGVGSPKIST